MLLDEFITSVEKDKQLPIEEARLAHEEDFFKHESPLDPLVSTLTRYTSDEDLNKQIQDIFELLDPAEKGTITFKELQVCCRFVFPCCWRKVLGADPTRCAVPQDGLRRLPFEPPIVLTSDDLQVGQHPLLREAG